MFELTELEFYKIIFVIQMLIAMHPLCWKLKKKNKPVLRYIITICISLLSGIFFPIFDGISYTAWYTSFVFLTLFVICMVGLFFVYDAPWQKIFFISIIAYTTQHFSHQLYSLICYSFDLFAEPTLGIYGNIIVDYSKLIPQLIVFINTFLIVYFAVFIILGNIVNITDAKVNKVSILVISILILIVDVILNSIVVYDQVTNKTHLIVICIYNMVCCLMIYYIQYSLITSKKLKNELDITSNLLYQAEQKFNENKENMELINMKCHDLKHQIRLFGTKANFSNSAIEDLENIINIYDSNIDTKNEALNLIMHEKSLLCQKNNIRLNCLADCSQLSFISNADLYSLFGNAIDNAIEAVIKIEDKEKRNINLTVKNTHSFISITLQNYFEGKIKLNSEGMPKTTKQDNNYHGFGLKSIKFIVDKYNGDFNFKINDNIFTISILFYVDQNS